MILIMTLKSKLGSKMILAVSNKFTANLATLFGKPWLSTAFFVASATTVFRPSSKPSSKFQNLLSILWIPPNNKTLTQS